MTKQGQQGLPLISIGHEAGYACFGGDVASKRCPCQWLAQKDDLTRVALACCRQVTLGLVLTHNMIWTRMCDGLAAVGRCGCWGIFLTKVTNFVVVAVTERAYIGTGGRENEPFPHQKNLNDRQARAA